MAPFGFDDDEWLAAQFLLLFDETGDEEEARRRTEELGRCRNEDLARRRTEELARRRAAQGWPPPPQLPPPPPASKGLWSRISAWIRRG